MEITGRLTADAQVRKVKGGKEVVSFTVAVNDGYRTKDGEWKELTEFFSCSYWMGSRIAETLPKGTIVTVSGRTYLNEYTGKDGNKYASLSFHVNGIKVIAKPKANSATRNAVAAAPVPTTAPETIDDLPF